MKLVGLMPVRNEDWVLGLSARVALEWCDELVILLHSCSDGSEAIAEAIRLETQDEDGNDRLHVGVQHVDLWPEMEHRNAMLNWARGLNATHIAMIDADEVATANLLQADDRFHEELPVRVLIESLAPGQMLELPGYNLRGSLDRYHSNAIWGNRWFSVAFKDNELAHWSGDKFHSREPAGIQWQKWRPIKQLEGGVLHLWGASERRLRAKHALYKVTERLRWPAKPIHEIDRLYNLWRDAREPWEFSQTPDHWWGSNPIEYMNTNMDAVPWQEAEVRRLVAEHGREKFTGLDLFGLA